MLTPYDVDILVRVTWTNMQIARHFGITEATVKNRLRGIYRKLGLPVGQRRKRWVALLRALKVGLISIDEVFQNDP